MKVFKRSDLQGRYQMFEVMATLKSSQVASMVLKPGETSGEYGNEHPDSEQILFVLDGLGEAKVGDDLISLERGDLLLIEKKESHQILGRGDRPLKTLNMYTPVAY